MAFASIREHAEHCDFFASTSRNKKFGEHEQGSTRLNFASKSSKGKILRAVKNFNGPFITPNNDQTGFLKGRFIGENIRLIDSVVNYTAAKNIPGLLFFLDFEKAFDTLEWSFIQKALISFGFGA